ncbi:MAG: response regulator [Anaerolineae bacterium]|nr:response regulator [Anaerolineae bacterium]
MPIKILLIDDDPDSVRLLTLMLNPEGYQITSARSGHEGLRLAAQEPHDLVVIDVMMPDMDGFEVCRTIRQTPGISNVPILMLSARTRVDDKIEGLRAGASDYMTKPINRKDLLARIEALLQVHMEQGARVIAVMGVKSGAGATTVATNLAIALRAASAKRVVLMDTRLPFGDLDLLLNVPAGRTWADLVPYINELDSDVVGTVLVPHASGIRVLLAPRPQEDLNALPSHVLARIVVLLKSIADYIVLDAPPPDQQFALSLLEVTDIVALVLTPDLATLSLTPVALEIARSRRNPPPEVHLVLNRAGSGLSATAIEAQLKLKLAAQLPDEEALVTVSANRGVPLIMSQPNSGLAREVRNFVKILTPEIREAKPGGTGLLGRLRGGS